MNWTWTQISAGYLFFVHKQLSGYDNLEDVFFNLTEEKSGYNFNMVTGYEWQNRTNIGIYLFEDSSSCKSSSSVTAQH